jgi:hypothetical protein
MIQYNVTLKLDPSIEEAWLEYMRSEHIQDVLDTGLFLSCRMSKLIDSQDNEPTYTVQYTLESMKKMHAYQVEHASKLQKEHTEKFKDQFVAFRTLMDVVEDMP